MNGCQLPYESARPEMIDDVLVANERHADMMKSKYAAIVISLYFLDRMFRLPMLFIKAKK